MATPSISQQLKPLAQRRRDAADRIQALQNQIRISQGIKVITCCSCGHEACGNPMPSTLPADAWVVHLGCRLEEPEQVTAVAIEEQVQASIPLTPQQIEDHKALLAMASSYTQPRTVDR